MNSKYRNNFIEAGKRAKEVRAYGKSLIQPGASYRDVTAKIRERIKQLGAIAAFPPQIAFNEVAAHYLPTSGVDHTFSDELIKLDVGICYRGAIGDCAVTIDLSGKHQKLIDATEAALLAAENILEVGLPIKEIGAVIEDSILSYGFQPVRNLAGHGLGHYKVHQGPTIPNCHCRMKEKIRPGMTFAIEPFATTGEGEVFEEGRAEIFSLTNAHIPTTGVAAEMLRQIQTFQGLPFEIEDLKGEERGKAVSKLLRLGIIDGYPALVEVAGGMVAQAENSVLIDDDGSVHIVTR